MIFLFALSLYVHFRSWTTWWQQFALIFHQLSNDFFSGCLFILWVNLFLSKFHCFPIKYQHWVWKSRSKVNEEFWKFETFTTELVLSFFGFCMKDDDNDGSRGIPNLKGKNSSPDKSDQTSNFTSNPLSTFHLRWGVRTESIFLA